MLKKTDNITKQVIIVFFILFFLLASFAFAESSKQDIIASFQQRKLACVSQDDYNKLVEELYAFLKKKPDFERSPYLHYLIAECRVDQLEELRKKGDLKAGRTYLKFKDSYYDEATSALQRSLEFVNNESLLIDICYLEFILNYHYGNQKLANDIFEKILNLTKNSSLDQINKITNELNCDYVSTKYAAQLYNNFKTYDIYSEKEIKDLADKLFLHNRIEESKVLYERYLELLHRRGVSEKQITDIIIDIADSFFEKDYLNTSAYFHNKAIHSLLTRLSEKDAINMLEEIGGRYFDKKEFLESKKLYILIEEKFGKNKINDIIFYKLATCFYFLKDYDEAIRRYKELREYSLLNEEDQLAEMATFSLACSHFVSTRDNDAIILFKKFKDTYKDSIFIPAATYYLGLCYYRNKDFIRARVEFSDFLNKYPQNSKAEEVEEYLNSIN